MSTVKVSTTLDAGRVAEAKARVGERGFSRFMDESLAMRLQWARVDTSSVSWPPSSLPKHSSRHRR